MLGGPDEPGEASVSPAAAGAAPLATALEDGADPLIDPDELVSDALGELETIAEAAPGDVDVAIDVATHSPDPALRSRALEALARHREEIPMAQDVFLAAYHQDAAPGVRALALALSSPPLAPQLDRP